MTSLFDPVTIGELTLKNRIFMAPLTRTRASGPGRVPNALMAQYYSQRASAGLIISEATSVTAMGVGYPRTPGIWSDEQVQGWRLVTDAVHQAGGTMLLQLWHVGRLSDSSYLDGALPVAPSAIAAAGHVSLIRPEKPYETPRALEIAEIPGIVEAYRLGAENAKKAGFDGVEIHGANGYLLEQFLASSSNHRTDAYGGSVENRARLMLEVTDAVLSVWPRGRVGMHLSPRGDGQSCDDTDPAATFGYVATELGKRGIAFLCTRESQDEPRLAPALKAAFGGTLIANQGLTQELGQALLDEGSADAVAFGKLFIANPDLPARFAAAAALNPWNGATFYAPGPEGYVDYPSLNG